MNTAVMWVRVSSVAQVDRYSLDSQERVLVDAANTHKLDIVKKYRIQESAKDSVRRKSFKEMLNYVRDQGIRYLLAYDVDRLARNYEDFYFIQKLIDENSVTVVIASENKLISKSSGPSDRFLFQISGGMAEQENRRRAEKTKAGMLEKAKQGWHPALCPVGYLNVPNPKNPERRIIAVDPARAPFVKKCFELYSSGRYSIHTLLDEMNRRGFKNKPTSRVPNGPLTKHGLERMLKNRFYIGEFTWAKHIFPGSHPPIIDPDVFAKVRVQLGNARHYSRPKVKKEFAFRGLLRCGYCGCMITAMEGKGGHKSGRYVYYLCNKNKKTKDHKKVSCAQGIISEKKIDELFKNAISDFYMDSAIADRIKSEMVKSSREQHTFVAREMRQLQAQLTRKRNHIDILYNDRLDGALDLNQYKTKRDIIQADIDIIQKQIRDLERENSAFQQEGSLLFELLKNFNKTYLEQDVFGRADILRIVLDECQIRSEGESTFKWKYPFNYLLKIGQMMKEGFIKNKVG